ncbi:unnamed protein product [Larinioides sclopetarius]|uniref:Uncharacterized protein n=1 Tax=Larinioides sclopetarius TaxID=280406 RepID=A0AAV2BQY2_9ARAC
MRLIKWDLKFRHRLALVIKFQMKRTPRLHMKCCLVDQSRIVINSRDFYRNLITKSMYYTYIREPNINDFRALAICKEYKLYSVNFKQNLGNNFSFLLRVISKSVFIISSNHPLQSCLSKIFVRGKHCSLKKLIS